MALLNVNPTRMVLLDLKRREKSAKRGHKLLKDKQDGLMQKFMEIIREAKNVRLEAEESLGKIFERQMSASSQMEPEMLNTALLSTKAKTELTVDTKNVMSVHIPQFELESSGDVISYGFWQTHGDLDISLMELKKVLPLLIKLAQIEKSAEALAVELETTRRRVNALEHKLIPDLQETVKFIKMKLGEAERGDIVTRMIMKAKLQEEEEAEREAAKKAAA